MKFILALLLLVYTTPGLTQLTSRYSVVITEFMADPSPSAGLPESEFIELRNISSEPVQLLNWRISNGKGYTQIVSEFLLEPDSLLILCPMSAQTAFQKIATSMGLAGFPALNNESGIIALYASDGVVIHALAYTKNLYGNRLKQEGGWSLEMIDLQYPCLETGNWAASKSPEGGTPGKANSITGPVNSPSVPAITKILTDDSSSIIIEFSQSMDSLTAADPHKYILSDGMGRPVSAELIPPLFRRVRLNFVRLPEKGRTYMLEINPLLVCTGNGTTEKLLVRAGFPEKTEPNDIVINEILFNPRPGNSDFLEIFNKSGRVKDVSKLYLATRNAGTLVSGIVKCSEEQQLLFPGDYLVFTEDSVMLTREYTVKDHKSILELSALPSFPDVGGTAILMNTHGTVIDEFRYDEKMHFALLTDKEGIALERIDPNAATQDVRNWHSAASDAGFATPGYQNSQSIPMDTLAGDIHISPLTFSPDQDGRDDLLTIQYRFPEAGYVCSIMITDPYGRMVRYLVRKNLCGVQGYFRWDGISEKNSRLPMGGYIIIVEMFDLKGRKKIRRIPVVLARRF